MEARHAAAVQDAKLSEVVVETGLVAAAAVAAAAVVAAAVVATSNAKQPHMPTMIALHTRLFKNQMQLSLQTPDAVTSQAWPDCNGVCCKTHGKHSCDCHMWGKSNRPSSASDRSRGNHERCTLCARQSCGSRTPHTSSHQASTVVPIPAVPGRMCKTTGTWRSHCSTVGTPIHPLPRGVCWHCCFCFCSGQRTTVVEALQWVLDPGHQTPERCWTVEVEALQRVADPGPRTPVRCQCLTAFWAQACISRSGQWACVMRASSCTVAAILCSEEELCCCCCCCPDA